ncbi:hypothetical protein [Flagellimonas allohymeniacidonis]|uniref:DUF4468 domain-containing protein n=1 Tax=Flagellimonas allohymeniacidonis TaxID=2517819 RepID=A0A4Q8QD39_9FLAO|nr:hypothetical protein [Allomuricauda hymeniacidonis]TAI47604.1 hypothetical protein EW142_13145 [Allomuricauda hymeniacidonis]
MKTKALKLFSLFVFLILGTSALAPNGISKNEELVKSFITARNNYDVAQVKALTTETYHETFVDGTKEIADQAQLLDRILWGKEMASQIKLLEIKSDSNTVTTLEENTNYLDVALKRKNRKFKIVYTVKNNRIQNQKIDTLPGYNQLLGFNTEKYWKFVEYCEKHGYTYNHQALNQEAGIYLRAVLEKYRSDNKQ